MLTAFQCEVVAYLGDGDVYCPECVPVTETEDEDLDYEDVRDAGYEPLIRYSAEESWPGGLWCGECGAEIVEPFEDYCIEHDSWLESDDDPRGKVCGSVDSRDPDPGCRFPEEVDPNPPVPRWVACQVCGAGDGQPHNLDRHDGS